MSNKRKRQKINVPVIEKTNSHTSEIISNPSSLINEPSVNLRYLHHSRTCLKEVGWSLRTNRPKFEEFFNSFQRFIADFSECKNISEATKQYSSHINGSTRDLGKNPHVVNMINCLPDKVAEYAKSEITHFHLKRNGKGIHVLYGFVLSNSFHVIGIDVGHTVQS